MANTILDVQSLTKTIGDLLLFSDISFSIAERQKVGLIARNGAGKTTLLNILSGHESYDVGQIVTRKGLRIGYLPQLPTYPPELTVMEACYHHAGELSKLVKDYEEALAVPSHPQLSQLMEQMDEARAWDYEARIKQILSKLKITDFGQLIGHLSGGQVKRIALANVLLMEPDLLLLDEPTNHLDLEMIEWLENYLKTSTCSLFMVTHDRYFLDRVCGEILELADHTLYAYQGGYSYYLEKRQERLDARNSELQRAQNLYRKELEWMRRMPQARGHKARYREDAFRELEKVVGGTHDERRLSLSMRDVYIGNKVFEAHGVSKSFDEQHVILNDFNYIFARYEKMGIVGGNGTGKTTFLRLLLGLERPSSGRFSVGQTVRFGYYSQEGMAIKEDARVIDVVRDIAEYVMLDDGRKLTASGLLSHFMFPPVVQNSYVAKLSGGERRRLYLCTVLMRNPNFLILDEPTNELDILTLQILEEYLQQFHGPVIIVSHDRYFMDKIVDHLLVFRGQGKVRDFPGNYTQYRECEQTEKFAPSVNETKVQTGAQTQEPRGEKPRTQRERRLTFKEKKELEQLSQDIDQMEKEQVEIETALSSGNLSVEEITQMSRRLPRLKEELDEKSMRWLELDELSD